MSRDEQMVSCNHCGESIEATAIFCRFCFSGLSHKHFRPCPACSEMIRRDALLCKYCQTAVAQAVALDRSEQDEEKLVAQFRSTFLAEIDNVLTYCDKIGDALFMIVNIIGKALQVSRCSVYCTDGDHIVWTYAEYWDRECVKGCREANWRASQSPLVARAVLAKEPLIITDGEEGKLNQVSKDELQLLQIKSLFSLPLLAETKSQGCLTLHQCDKTRQWAADEVTWLESIARALGQSLASLQTSENESD